MMMSSYGVNGGAHVAPPIGESNALADQESNPGFVRELVAVFARVVEHDSRRLSDSLPRQFVGPQRPETERRHRLAIKNELTRAFQPSAHLRVTRRTGIPFVDPIDEFA